MVINAGIRRFISSQREGGFKVYMIENWILEWQDKGKDIIDDKHQYGADQNSTDKVLKDDYSC
jgi:hypothetical protein